MGLQLAGLGLPRSMDVRTLAARHRASGEFLTPAAAQLYERASFELNEEDIQALRKHFDSFARLNGSHCPCPRPEAAEQALEYQRWQVGCQACVPTVCRVSLRISNPALQGLSWVADLACCALPGLPCEWDNDVADLVLTCRPSTPACFPSLPALRSAPAAGGPQSSWTMTVCPMRMTSSNRSAQASLHFTAHRDAEPAPLQAR